MVVYLLKLLVLDEGQLRAQQDFVEFRDFDS